MNKEVMKALEEIKGRANEIIANCQCIIKDAEEVGESSDLFIIEASFERIQRVAEKGYKETQKTWDLFEESEREE